MNYRRITGLFGAAGALTVGTEIAQAQEEDLGDDIANTVTSAVSSIATNSSGSVSGGESVESSQVELGEQTGLAIADASGGSNNVAFVS